MSLPGVRVVKSAEQRAAHGRHVCGFCDERIVAGEVYRDRRCAFVVDGWSWVERHHMACAAELEVLEGEGS